MALILNIETATAVCSVCVSNDNEILAIQEINEGLKHAENLHPFIEEVLQQAGLKPKDLNAIALSKGPGSYTGLRIGSSAAKGLCYALQIPLLGIDTLQAMTCIAREQVQEKALYCPMLDARRQEVYTAVYNQELEVKEEVQALIVNEESIQFLKQENKICFFGEGMPKCKTVLSTLPNALFLDNIIPSSQYIAQLANEQYKKKIFEDPAYFEPLYLKEFFTTAKKI